MPSVVVNAYPVEPLKRVRIGMPDTVRADSLHEIVSIQADSARPRAHMVIRWIVPGAVMPGASLRRVDGDGRVAHGVAGGSRWSRMWVRRMTSS